MARSGKIVHRSFTEILLRVSAPLVVRSRLPSSVDGDSAKLRNAVELRLASQHFSPQPTGSQLPLSWQHIDGCVLKLFLDRTGYCGNPAEGYTCRLYLAEYLVHFVVLPR